jgi:hypothetical protein
MQRILPWVLAATCAVGPATASVQEPPGTAESGVAMGVRQVEDGDFEGAVKTLEAAIARLRGDPQRVRLLVQADIQLAVAHVALDHATEAVQAFSEALALDPSLRLGADRYSPKVLRAFETAREQAARRTGTSTAGRSSHKAWLLGGGAAVAVGTAIVLATRGGSTTDLPTFSGTRFGTPVLDCPNGSENLRLPFTILIEASNPSGSAVPITSASTVVRIVDATIASELGFSSNKESTVLPSSLPARQSVTVQVTSYLLCGNGDTDAPRFNVWSGTVTLTTAAGVFMLDTADRMRVNIP